MERLFYQREWQGIRLGALDRPSTTGVVGRDFYHSFYQRLLQADPVLTTEWLEDKRRLAHWLATTWLVARDPQEPLRVLSVGAGLGIVEHELWMKGYEVNALECNEHALRYLAGRCPGLRVMVGDARSLPYQDASFDVVYMATVDYCFDRADYVQVLCEMRRVLRLGGLALSLCASNLSWPTLLRACTLEMFFRGRKNRQDTTQVPWGYQRTVGEHLRAGRTADLRCEGVYVFNQHAQVKTVRRAGAWHLAWPTLRDDMVVVALCRAPRAHAEVA